MVIWLAVCGAMVGAVARWRVAEARSERAFAAAEAERRARRRGRGQARITRLEYARATLLGMPVARLTLELELPARTATIELTRALAPAQIAWVKVDRRLDTTYDPDDLANFATELEGRFADEIRDRVARSQRPRVRAVLAAPLWAHGHEGAHAWLVRPGGARVVVARAADSHDQASALRAAEELAFTTSIGGGAAVALGIAPGGGALLPDPDADGADLDAADDPEATVAAWIAEGRAVATPPPAWYRPPRGDAAAAAYAQILAGLARQLAAHEVGVALAADVHAGLAGRALALAHAHDDGFVHLAALACVLAAARAGAMTLEQRVYASELVGHYAGTGHPIDLLAPSFLVAFNLRREARARLRALRRAPDAFRAPGRDEHPGYAEWLARRFP